MTTYSVTVIRNLPDGRGEGYDDGHFDSLKHLLEAIAQDMEVYPDATSFVFTITQASPEGLAFLCSRRAPEPWPLNLRPRSSPQHQRPFT
jgi:hypothetical protein